jgi:copper(I)-binding protein
MDIFLRMLISLGLGFLVLNVSAATTDIQVLDPWVQAAPPNAKVLAAYLQLKNAGAKPQTVTAVSSPAFDRVEIHRTVVSENTARMEHLKELTIPPNATIVMKPGGLHFMLIGARKRLQTGDSIPISLTLKDGNTFAVSATVRAAQMDAGKDHQGMDHSKHGAHAH